MDLVNYQGIVESLDSPEFAKSGYRVILSRSRSSIDLSLSYQSNIVGNSSVSLTKRGTYGDNRVSKLFTEILADVRDEAVRLYNRHNESLENPDLLKALEDRLNGSAEMLVLVEGDSKEDNPKWVEVGPRELKSPVWDYSR